MKDGRIPGRQAWEARGFWPAHRFLVLRRAAQLGFLALFLSGPILGVWITRGTLASSLTLDVLPLTDPLIVLQSLAAGHWPEATALAGAGIVLAGYLLLGGRSYCAWVCPINPVADFAAWLRRRLGIRKGWTPRRGMRRYLLAAILVVAAATGTIAWELVNPVTTFHRALVYGLATGAASVAVIFLFDLFVARHGWCGSLCPVGAFYGLVGEVTLLRVSAAGRDRCDDCLDCYAVCPEPHVLVPALKGGGGPIVVSGDCTTCGRCIDVCPHSVFRLTHRFDRRTAAVPRAETSNGGPTVIATASPQLIEGDTP